MPDDETESYRVEQGRPPRPDPRDRQADVPLAFSTGGVLRSGADEREDIPNDAAGRTADATEAVERGAAAVAAERRAAGDGGEGAAAGPDAAARPPASRRP